MDRKELKDFTATETLIEAMKVLSEQEAQHGPAVGCMVIFLHRSTEADGGGYEVLSGFHNIPSYTTQLGVIEGAKLYFYELGPEKD